MKFGVKTPSLKKKISSRTSAKRLVSHNLGIKAPKGMGVLRDPKKAVYNKIYNKTTISASDLISSEITTGKKKKRYIDDYDSIVDLSLYDETDMFDLISVEFSENGKTYDYLGLGELNLVGGEEVFVEASGEIKVATVVESQFVGFDELNPRIKYKPIIGLADEEDYDFEEDLEEDDTFVKIGTPHEVPDDLKWHEKLIFINAVAFFCSVPGLIVGWVLLFKSRRFPLQGKLIYSLILFVISGIGTGIFYS